MSSLEHERIARVQELFHELCDLPAEQQVARLRDLEDPDLRGRLEALLWIDAGPRQPLDEPPGAIPVLPVHELPRWVGAYEILGELGRGSMGVVYEARQPTPRRTVALKLLAPGLVTRERFRRFRDEGEALGSLNHPGIAQVYETGSAQTPAGELPYIAMERVRGERLDVHVRRAGLGVHEILELVSRLCDAVHHAHERGIVHRDLKPSNVLVTEEGVPKVLDFGVARISDAGGDRTRTGELIGTLAYMSPEQVRPDRGPIDARTDVYALGVMAYELLGGTRPTQVDSQSLPEAARSIVEDPVLPLGRIDRRLRGDVEILVGKAIAKEPERRYASAAAFAADLRRFLSDEPVRARPDSRLYLLRKFSRRNRSVVVGVTAAFLAMAAGTALALWQAGEADAARRLADAERRGARIEAYRGTLAAAQATLEVGNITDTEQALERIPVEERGWEWRYVRSQLDQAEVSVEGLGAEGAALDRDGHLVAVSAQGLVSWIDPQLGEVLRSETLGVGPLRGLAFAADGRHLAVLHGDDARQLGVWELDADSGLTRSRHASLEQEGRWVALSATGTTVCVAGADCAWIYREGLGDPVRWVHGMKPTGLALSAAGTKVALVGSGELPGVFRALEVPGDVTGDIAGAITDAITDAITGDGGDRVTPDLGRDVVSMTLSPEGRLALTCESDGIVRLRDAGSGRVLFRLSTRYAGLRFAALDLHGRRVAAVGEDGALRLWGIDPSELLERGGELGDRDSQPTVIVPGHGAAIRSLSFDPSGQKLVTTDAAGTVRVSDVRAVRGPRSLARGGRSHGLALSREGARIVAACDPGELVFWSGNSSEAYASLPFDLADLGALALSSDGAWLATARGGEIALRRLEDPVEPTVLARVEADVRALAFAPGGRLAALDARGVLRLWDAQARTQVLEVALEGATEEARLAFSPSGELLAAATSRLSVLEAASGRELLGLRVDRERPLAVSWLPEGRVAASGWSDGDLRLFDLDADTRTELPGSRGAILALAPLADGRRLAAGTAQGIVEIWDLETGRPTLGLRAFQTEVSSLAAMPDGARLLCSAPGATIQLLDAESLHRRRAAAAAEVRLSPGLRSHLQQLLAATPDPLSVARLLWSDRSLSEHDRQAALRWTLCVPAPDPGLAGDPFDGHALAFHGGDDHVLVGGDERELRLETACTMELWVRPRALDTTTPPESTRLQTLLCKEGEYQIAIESGSGELHWLVAGPQGWMPWRSSRYSAPRDRWTHLALVCDGPRLRFLVNGRVVQVLEGPQRYGDHSPAMNELRIGGRQHTASGFVGEIDEVRLWSTARSEAQLAAGMRRGPAGDEPGLIAAWSFDEGRGSVARDLRGGHDGTLVGAEWLDTRSRD